MNSPKSKFTPELPFLCTVLGFNVYSNGFACSVDEKLTEQQIGYIIDYLIDEDFITDNFVFLS